MNDFNLTFADTENALDRAIAWARGELARREEYGQDDQPIREILWNVYDARCSLEKADRLYSGGYDEFATDELYVVRADLRKARRKLNLGCVAEAQDRLEALIALAR